MHNAYKTSCAYAPHLPRLFQLLQSLMHAVSLRCVIHCWQRPTHNTAPCRDATCAQVSYLSLLLQLLLCSICICMCLPQLHHQLLNLTMPAAAAAAAADPEQTTQHSLAQFSRQAAGTDTTWHPTTTQLSALMPPHAHASHLSLLLQLLLCTICVRVRLPQLHHQLPHLAMQAGHRLHLLLVRGKRHKARQHAASRSAWHAASTWTVD
jgi:hypothetical protein